MHPASPAKGLWFSVSQGHQLLLPRPSPKSPTQHLRAEPGAPKSAPERRLVPKGLHPPHPQHPSATVPSSILPLIAAGMLRGRFLPDTPGRLLPLPLNLFHLPRAWLREGSLGWGTLLRPAGGGTTERGSCLAAGCGGRMREGRCELFHQHEGSEPILGGFQLLRAVPVEAGECGTLCSSLLNPSSALAPLHSQEKAPWVDAACARPQQPGGMLPRGLGQRRGFGGISRSPDHAGCALGLPLRAGGRRCQLRAMQDPSPSHKICLHLARVAQAPPCFSVHGKHGRGSEEDA